MTDTPPTIGGLSECELTYIRGVFMRDPKIKKVILFGSRAKGNFKPNSDIDLALVGQIDDIHCEQVRLDLEELPTLYRFDVLDEATVKNALLRNHIKRVGVALYERA